MVVSGTTRSVDGRDLEPGESLAVAASFNTLDGSFIERSVYAPAATGIPYKLVRAAPLTSGGYALLGTMEGGFVVIKTDPTGKAAMSITDVVQVPQ